MRKSIAQKKAQEVDAAHGQAKSSPPAPKTPRAHPIAAATACVPFAAIWYVCKNVLPGYSFTALVPMVGRVLPRFARVCTIVFTLALICGLILFGVTEYFIIRASFGTPETQVDYLVVLGAKVRQDGPSVSLWDRIYETVSYLNAHPDTIAIVSGGQGEDEPITEAKSMHDELVKLGISEDRIWMESKATSTDENLRYSLDLIEEKTGRRPQTLGVLSSEYHLFRASLMAKKLGVEFVGVPAKTTKITQLINHAMREVAGVWHFYIFGR